MPLLSIECPCSCGQTLPVKYAPKVDEAYIPLLGNIIWQQLVSENGFEGAVEFLHGNSDIEWTCEIE